MRYRIAFLLENMPDVTTPEDAILPAALAAMRALGGTGTISDMTVCVVPELEPPK